MEEPLNYNVLVDMMKELLVHELFELSGPSECCWIPEYSILSGKEGLSAFIHILHYTESIYDTGDECLVKLFDDCFFDLTYFYEPFNELAWMYAKEISLRTCDHVFYRKEAALGLSKNRRLNRLIFSKHEYISHVKYVMDRINVSNLEYFEGFPSTLTVNVHKKFTIKRVKIVNWDDGALEEFFKSKNIVCTDVLSVVLYGGGYFDYPFEVTTQNYKNIQKLEFDYIKQFYINDCLEMFKDLLPSVTEIVFSAHKLVELHNNETLDTVERSFKDNQIKNYGRRVIINYKLVYHSHRKYAFIPVELLHSKKEIVIKKDVILYVTMSL